MRVPLQTWHVQGRQSLDPFRGGTVNWRVYGYVERDNDDVIQIQAAHYGMTPAEMRYLICLQSLLLSRIFLVFLRGVLTLCISLLFFPCPL